MALQWKLIIVLPFFVHAPPITSVGAVYCQNFLYPVIMTVQNLGLRGVELGLSYKCSALPHLSAAPVPDGFDDTVISQSSSQLVFTSCENTH